MSARIKIMVPTPTDPQEKVGTLMDVINSQEVWSEIFSSISNLKTPDGYPHIEDISRENAIKITGFILEKFKILPCRISPSVEGGIAIIYRSKKRGILKKKYLECFIEIYNDSSFIFTLHSHFNILEIKEAKVYDENLIFDFIKNLSFEQYSAI